MNERVEISGELKDARDSIPESPRRATGSFLDRRVSRREFGDGVVSVTAWLALVAAFGAGGKLVLDAQREGKLPNSFPDTREQAAAARLFETSADEHFVHDILVVGEKVRGKTRASVRNKPKTEADARDTSAGARREFPVGVRIPRALAVWGGDPKAPWDRNSQAKWLAFPMDSMGGKTVFASERVVELTPELAMVVPVSLSDNPGM